jgi:hypothetical protein
VNTSTGVRNPIYYAAVEVKSGVAVPTFFAGPAASIDLCSVSACTPHVVDYPAPPNGGTSVNGQVILNLPGKPDSFVITVPRSVVGSVTKGAVLESLSAFTFARQDSASIQITNAQAEAGILPIEVDGVCCVNVKLTA